MEYFELLKTHPHLFQKNTTDALEIVLDRDIILNWTKTKKAELKKNNLPLSWGDIGILYDDPYIVVIRDLVKSPKGNLKSYFRIFNQAELKNGKSVVVMPMYRDKIVIQKIFRHPIRNWSWEFPRGFGEPNVSPEKNARKEVSEEIGGEIITIQEIGTYYNNTGLEATEVFLFFAELKTIGKPNNKEEIYEIKLSTTIEFEKMIIDGEIFDGFTIAAYTKAKLFELI